MDREVTIYYFLLKFQWKPS